MTNTTKTQNHNAHSNETPGFGTSIPFDSLSDPGCYVCNWSGHLLRVPEDGVAAGRSPVLNIIGNEPLFVTKISDNPYIPITKAKMLACNSDLHVTF